MYAQIGLGVDPTGGILILALGALLALAGLVSCIAGAALLVRSSGSRPKAVLILFIGVVLLSPALWFAYEIFAPDMPREKHWDLSASRSVAQLREEKQQESFYYQGNIRSTIKLSPARQWSGSAYLVVFRTKSGEIVDIHWQSPADPASQAYGQAKLVLAGLGLAERDLDLWYEKVSRGEQASFVMAAGSEGDASVEVQVRGSVAEQRWVVHVNVWWK